MIFIPVHSAAGQLLLGLLNGLSQRGRHLVLELWQFIVLEQFARQLVAFVVDQSECDRLQYQRGQYQKCVLVFG